MDPKLAEAIGLLRHQIISPVIMEAGPAQMAYFRQIAAKEFDVPGRGLKRFTASTMKGWLYRYRKKGFIGIVPKTRSDVGGFRKLTAEDRGRIKALRQENLDRSCVKFYNLCVNQQILGDPPVGIETVRRFLKIEGLYQKRETRARKRFEMNYVGELWTADFMHGPQVLENASSKRRRKAILMAIIDDHSRVIVGARFGFLENTQLLEQVFKEAILAHGLPDRCYVDNGSAFSSHYLARVCAYLNVGLVHSKPYDSPSRGKIERFFRNIREGFLVEAPLDAQKQCTWDLKELNEALQKWLRDEYHHVHHHGINQRPIDRYQISVRDYPRKRVAEETLDEFFLVSTERTVAKDCTVSLHGNDYEVPPEYIGKRVELRFAQEHPNEVFLYDNGVRIQKVHLVDSRLNGKLYQPTPRISDVALHEMMKNAPKDGGQR